MRKLVNRELGVSEHAYDMTAKITLAGEAHGWTVHGKTGSGGGNCRYVGWATKEYRTVVFAHLLKKEDSDTSGMEVALRARDEILAELPR